MKRRDLLGLMAGLPLGTAACKTNNQAPMEPLGSGSKGSKTGGQKGLLKNVPGPYAGAPWMDWDQGLKRAQGSGLPLMMLVYADWCSKCKKLGPVFRKQAMLKSSSGVVLVLQDADKQPSWLGQLRTGSYVPRVLFFDSQGKLNRGLRSPNRRYPYFYMPSDLAALQQNLSKAKGA